MPVRNMCYKTSFPVRSVLALTTLELRQYSLLWVYVSHMLFEISFPNAVELTLTAHEQFFFSFECDVFHENFFVLERRDRLVFGKVPLTKRSLHSSSFVDENPFNKKHVCRWIFHLCVDFFRIFPLSHSNKKSCSFSLSSPKDTKDTKEPENQRTKNAHGR